MVKRPNEDLFSDSTMTFGEHLEELRAVLAKAVVGLVVGFLVGLYLADYVVSWIQEPLRRSLEEHYVTQAVERLTDEYREKDGRCRRESRNSLPNSGHPRQSFVEAGESQTRCEARRD